MMAELCMLGRFYDIPEILFYQRVHSDSMSSVDGEKNTHSASYRTPLFLQIAGFFSTPTRYALDLWGRICCYGWIAVYILQFRKWSNILRDRL